MANFGASLAQAAGAGLLQYGQFKYQEQIEAMREANMAKREAARMEYEKAQRAEDRALRKTEREEDRALRTKERGEDLAFAREQMAAQDAKWKAQFNQQAHQFNETMGFKRVDDLNSTMDSVYARSQARLDKLEELRLKAAADPTLSGNQAAMADYTKQIDEAKKAVITERESSMASLFEANPALATKSKYYGGESWKLYQNTLQAGQAAGVPSPSDFAATISPGTPGAARNSRDEGGADRTPKQQPQPAAVVDGADAALLRKAQETPVGLLWQGTKSLAGGIVDAGKTAVDDTVFVVKGLAGAADRTARRIAYPAAVARVALTTPINQEAADLARQIENEGDIVKRQRLLERLRQLQSK
jgi:hypothetical protein